MSNGVIYVIINPLKEISIKTSDVKLIKIKRNIYDRI